MTAIWLGLVAGVCGAFGAFLLKLSSQRNPKLFYLGASALAYFIGLGITLLVIRKNPLSIVYALSSVQYPTALVLGRFFLKERITMLKVASVALIVGGVSLLLVK